MAQKYYSRLERNKYIQFFIVNFDNSVKDLIRKYEGFTNTISYSENRVNVSFYGEIPNDFVIAEQFEDELASANYDKISYR